MVHQPKSANIHVVAERCTGSAFVSLTSLALYLMTTNMAATSDYKTERGPSVTPNGVDNTDCDDSDNMESCLEIERISQPQRKRTARWLFPLGPLHDVSKHRSS